MSRVVRIKGYLDRTVLKRLMVTSSALVTLASGFALNAKAATQSLLGSLPGTVQPMYGVPYNPPFYGGQIVKYGPPPTATPKPPYSGLPSFDWGSIWSPSSWQSPTKFTAPDFGHMFPTFPKLMGSIALVAFISLAAIAVLGLAMRGSIWRIKKI
jgi:hypothetical protein